MRLSSFAWLAAALSMPIVSAIPKVSSERSPVPFFYKGHDLSSLKMLEDDENYIYKDTARNNKTRKADAILGDGGMNTVRLRIWVNPEGGLNGLQYVLTAAKRYQKNGYKIYLDFHFGDSWTDPQKQYPPAAWPTTLAPLASTLRTYVNDTLVAFSKAGIDLEIVSLGNEIRHGMLWPVGYVDVDVQPYAALVRNFSSLATLYKNARKGVDDAVARGTKKPLVMIHIDNGWNATLQLRWFGALVENGVKTTDWDVFGFSFYPFYGTAATFANLETTLHTLAEKYRKPLQIAETDYPAICKGQYNPIPASSEPSIPYDVAGQLEWTDDVVSIVKAVPYGLGRGVHYWEPAWLNNTSLGSACEDATLFEADYSGWPLTVGYSRASVNLFKGV